MIVFDEFQEDWEKLGNDLKKDSKIILEYLRKYLCVPRKIFKRILDGLEEIPVKFSKFSNNLKNHPTKRSRAER